MTDMAYIASRTLENKIAIAENNDQNTLLVTLDVLKEILALLKEQEAKTGKWILDDDDANSWECSECGGLLIINDGTPHENDWYFCPYCGAKLDKQEEKFDD